MKEYRNILIRMPNWLGDMVMATPIIADVRKKWPQATITVMSSTALAPLLFGNPHLNEIFSFSRINEFAKRAEKRDVVARLRQGQYDLGILLTNSFSSAVLLWKGRINERVGFAKDFRSLFLTKSIPLPKMKGREHLVVTYKRLLEPLGIAASDTAPELFVMEEEREAIGQLLREYSIPRENRLIGINPLAAFGEAKCWPAERFRTLAIKLASDKRTTVLFFGDNQGVARIKEICAGLPENVVNFAGLTTLRELIALIEVCDLFVTNDSGPMHIAAALKTPLIAIFGSTNEIATGPYQHGRVIHKHASCSPCYLRKCPIDFRCMKRIDVEEVMKEVNAALLLQKGLRS